ncbi:MAG TPA: SDR family NAD(P)-dependent oxidoreductase [Chthoniobacterales bacterium]|jgi:NAD(P)-dependent dehydrogenase (short-subunit alcohol dehydrogenase family)|nr:SDR family NAD(P)-dependent oxidoreductase [Chthoniobacterales bacterium]
MKSNRVFVGAAAIMILSLLLRRIKSRFSFAGQTVIITGGSRGLGFALAQWLARERVNLAIIARDEQELQSAQSKLSTYGSTVSTWVCDVRKESELRATILAIAQRFGRIDLLINNAGEIVVGPFEAMSGDDFEQALMIHLWAPLNAISAALPHLQNSGGRIVNIASFGGKLSVPHLLPYCVSKFALVGLSDGLRAELAARKVSVTTIAPGLMRTGSHKNALFKGAHRQEFGWFSLGAGSPLVSIDGRRAAQQILAAAYRRQPELVITFPARAAIVAQALFPSLVAQLLKLITRFLPKMPAEGGSEIRSGWQSQSKLSPSLLTTLADRATQRFNEGNGKKGH